MEGAVAGGILVNYSVTAPTGVTTTTNITYNTVTITNAALTAASGGVIGINTQGITVANPTATINITNATTTVGVFRNSGALNLSSSGTLAGGALTNLSTINVTSGGNITREPGPVKGGTSVIAFITDPDGYKIELIERR